jgi:hypothetical protein
VASSSSSCALGPAPPAPSAGWPAPPRRLRTAPSEFKPRPPRNDRPRPDRPSATGACTAALAPHAPQHGRQDVLWIDLSAELRREDSSIVAVQSSAHTFVVVEEDPIDPQPTSKSRCSSAAAVRSAVASRGRSATDTHCEVASLASDLQRSLTVSVQHPGVLRCAVIALPLAPPHFLVFGCTDTLLRTAAQRVCGKGQRTAHPNQSSAPTPPAVRHSPSRRTSGARLVGQAVNDAFIARSLGGDFIKVDWDWRRWLDCAWRDGHLGGRERGGGEEER